MKEPADLMRYVDAEDIVVFSRNRLTSPTENEEP